MKCLLLPKSKLVILASIFCLLCFLQIQSHGQKTERFNVIAFYTAANDAAHISFVHEANKWLSLQSKKYHFRYDSTNNWENLNAAFLANYQVVIFLDTRPEKFQQREAFRNYIEAGGGWMGFHFSAFALTPSAYPQDWDWYHHEFLGSGEYKSNTWRPTLAMLRVENKKHPATKKLPDTFKSAPNEWYCWKNDLTKNPDIQILLAIDSSSFPLGTGPKPHEIWHEGYYPVVWTNKKYRMVYLNMGHNDMDYEGATNKALSSSFSSELQNQLIINSLLWLAKKKKAAQ